MLDKKLEKAINDQINQELSASYTYMAMAAYLDKQNLTGYAKWMEQQSEEERGHAHRLFRYLLDRDANVTLEAISKPMHSFGSLKDVFQRSLKQERENTKAIYELYDLARAKQDYATLAHLQWFLDEQVEEEKTMGDILGRIELAGDEKTAILILDDQISRRADGKGASKPH